MNCSNCLMTVDSRFEHVIRCLHEAIVAAIGRAIDRTDRRDDRRDDRTV